MGYSPTKIHMMDQRCDDSAEIQGGRILVQNNREMTRVG